MERQWFKGMTIKTRILIFTIALVVVLSAVMSSLSLYRLSKITRDFTYTYIAESLNANLECLKKCIISSYGGELRYVDGKIVGADGRSVDGDFTAVDKCKEESKSNGYASILILRDEHFLRISTNILSSDGQRLYGTRLDKNHTAYYPVITEGKYIGEAEILGKTYLAYYEAIYHENKVIGMLYVGVPIETVEQISAAHTKEFIISEIPFILIIMLLACILGTLVINRALKPIRNAVCILKNISEHDGDLTRRMKVNRNDEMGELALYLNKYLDMTFKGIIVVIENSQNLYEKSTTLMSTTKSLNKLANEMNKKSQGVADLTKEINKNTTSIAITAKESNTSVNVVASNISAFSESLCNINRIADTTRIITENTLSSIKQLDENINEACALITNLTGEVRKISKAIDQVNDTSSDIVASTKQVNSITTKAKTQTTSASNVINNLQGISSEVEKIIKIIVNVADKTNMLALNATIEATKAGEAGKGFAIVAEEIKTLSKQTQNAIEHINTEIEKIHSSASQSVDYISDISMIIDDLSDIVKSVVASVEEQNSTTYTMTKYATRISANSEDAKRKIESIVSNSNSIKENSSQISNTIIDVYNSTSEAAQSSEEIATSSEQASICVSDITRTTIDISKAIMQVTKSIEDMLADIEATTSNVEKIKNVADECNHIAELLAQQTAVYKV